MKQLVINISAIILLTVISSSVLAQTDQGNVSFSGTTGLMFISSTSKDIDNYGDKIKISTMEFSPQIGIFYARNCLAGLAIQYNSNSTKTSISDSNTSSVFVMPILMFYLGKELIKPFVYTGLGKGKTTENRNNYSYLEKYNQTLFEAGFGIAAFINKNISLDIGAAYSSVNSKKDQVKLTTSGFGFQAGFSIYL